MDLGDINVSLLMAHISGHNEVGGCHGGKESQRCIKGKDGREMIETEKKTKMQLDFTPNYRNRVPSNVSKRRVAR